MFTAPYLSTGISHLCDQHVTFSFLFPCMHQHLKCNGSFHLHNICGNLLTQVTCEIHSTFGLSNFHHVWCKYLPFMLIHIMHIYIHIYIYMALTCWLSMLYSYLKKGFDHIILCSYFIYVIFSSYESGMSN